MAIKHLCVKCNPVRELMRNYDDSFECTVHGPRFMREDREYEDEKIAAVIVPEIIEVMVPSDPIVTVVESDELPTTAKVKVSLKVKK